MSGSTVKVWVEGWRLKRSEYELVTGQWTRSCCRRHFVALSRRDDVTPVISKPCTRRKKRPVAPAGSEMPLNAHPYPRARDIGFNLLYELSEFLPETVGRTSSRLDKLLCRSSAKKEKTCKNGKRIMPQHTLRNGLY